MKNTSEQNFGCKASNWPIHIYLLHDYQLFSDLFTQVLEYREDVCLAGSTKSPQEAMDSLHRLVVDVVIIDASIESTVACNVILRLREEITQIRVLPIGLKRHQDVPELIESGAHGYLLAGASFREMIEGIISVHQGEPICSRKVAAHLCTRIQDLSKVTGPDLPGLDSPLTPREKEILELIAEGLSNKEIARVLYISLSTVKNHVHNILNKLRASRRRDAIRHAYKAGILQGALQ